VRVRGGGCVCVGGGAGGWRVGAASSAPRHTALRVRDVCVCTCVRTWVGCKGEHARFKCVRAGAYVRAANANRQAHPAPLAVPQRPPPFFWYSAVRISVLPRVPRNVFVPARNPSSPFEPFAMTAAA
jgi:hypothetical protein